MRLRVRPSAGEGVATAGVCVLAALALAPDPAQSRARACPPAGLRTLTATREVRVFRKGEETYACHVRARGRPHFLAGRNYDETIRVLRISGKYVGYSAVADNDPDTASVRVIDVRRGTLERLDRRGGTVTDLELRPSGSVAWISRLPDGRPAVPLRYEVYSGGDGETELIDEGTDVDPRSLVLRQRTLYWTRGGVRRSVTLR